MAAVKTDVLRVITRLNIGGPAIQALLLSRELTREFPTVLAAGDPSPGEGELHDPRVEVCRVPLMRALHPYTDLRAFASVRQLIHDLRPGIVHSHMAKAGAIARLAALRSSYRPRTVHTFHGHVLQSYFNRATEKILIEAEQFLARRTDALVAVSEQTRDELLALGIGTPDQWRVIPLGFDLGPFNRVGKRSGVLRDRLSIADDDRLVGVLGRLAPVKDHALLFDAIARLPDVHLAVLGDGELRAKLERAASVPSLLGRVHFLGWRKDVPEVLADLDVVALTSLNEGTPVTLIEALAAARPVVATDVGGVRSVVRHGIDGFLVRERDAAQIAAHLDDLLGDEELRIRFGMAGRARVLDLFAKQRLVRDIRDLYIHLLES